MAVTPKTVETASGKASINNEHYWDTLGKICSNIIVNLASTVSTLQVCSVYNKLQKKTSKSSAESFVNDDSSYHNINAGEKNKTVGSGLSETSMLSYMLRLNYSYAGKYMLTLTGRSRRLICLWCKQQVTDFSVSGCCMEHCFRKFYGKCTKLAGPIEAPRILWF